MSFLYEEKASRSALVDVVWRTVDTSDGTYLAAADACWDMIFSDLAAGGRRVLLSGPSSQPTPVPYTAGNRNIGVRFVQGCYFTHCAAADMCDRTIALRMPQATAFDLADVRWPFPDYETVDDLVEAFAAHGLLAHDQIVESILVGRPPGVSVRSVQRHFAKVTGLSPHHVRQISRARAAVNRLQTGEAIADVAYDLGYADQSHLTREVKRLTGCTPGQSQHRGEPV
ncbi:AraC-like DNA-binding protein [Agromyces flavus]|uniref:AraC-like DNA-binding protein n=1 Tax=Agromyces flavus TaxID=589382 RepID=A0A1H1NUA7_9MICO|nr:helix-turn-helix domain-containing protein [Agromyces flavus]MCP2368041.1 AraC-like DNA-binding protein [Agromyces flavus]GGI47503.1 AraC family transcriptional regulator [Agromyces flavus]SDS02556.1 Helix-turn-helix domain-containing protein [Agromyces flavus]